MVYAMLVIAVWSLAGIVNGLLINVNGWSMSDRSTIQFKKVFIIVVLLNGSAYHRHSEPTTIS